MSCANAPACGVEQVLSLLSALQLPLPVPGLCINVLLVLLLLLLLLVLLLLLLAGAASVVMVVASPLVLLSGLSVVQVQVLNLKEEARAGEDMFDRHPTSAIWLPTTIISRARHTSSGMMQEERRVPDVPNRGLFGKRNSIVSNIKLHVSTLFPS